MSTFGDVGSQLMQDLARQIQAGTPEAQIAAAEAAKKITKEAADAMRNDLRATEEARSLATQMGEAFVDALDEQRDAAVKAAERFVGAATDRMAALRRGIDDELSREDAVESVSDDERSVAQARAALEAARQDPEKADDIDDLEERLSDAERQLRRSNLRLFWQLFDEMDPNGQTIGADSELARVGQAAGLSLYRIQELANQAHSISAAEQFVSSQQNAPITPEQFKLAMDEVFAKYIGEGNTINRAVAVQALTVLLEEIERQRRAGQ